MTQTSDMFDQIQDVTRPPLIIAELSANHSGDLGRALEIIAACGEAGADALKLQTYTADTITLNHDGPGFVLEGGLWHGRKLHDLYEEAHTPWEWHEALFEAGRKAGMAVFSSPFDFSAIDFLEQFDPPAYKIASFELIDLPLIAHAARTGRPLVMSTGMASWDEVMEAVLTARQAGCDRLCVLHCTSGYPTPIEEADLRTLPDLAMRLGLPVGLSDHTPGIAAPVAATALGARAIEKHVTMRRSDGGPDAAFSLEPDELAALVRETRNAHAALGQVRTGTAKSEEGSKTVRRSLYVAAPVKAGETLTPDNVRSVRPGGGLHPREYTRVLGRSAARDLTFGEPLDWSMVEGGHDT
ncbi:pseudaminic acid synthase [Marinicauda pacifica]|uniref:pseudaminic acid synthase n=1 Tax=Marinicauda pacifica TaxID=1133559 RepID=UPI0035C7C445